MAVVVVLQFQVAVLITLIVLVETQLLCLALLFSDVLTKTQFLVYAIVQVHHIGMIFQDYVYVMLLLIVVHKILTLVLVLLALLHTSFLVLDAKPALIFLTVLHINQMIAPVYHVRLVSLLLALVVLALVCHTALP